MGRDALVRLISDANQLPVATGADPIALVGPAPLRSMDRRQRGGSGIDDPLDPAALKIRVRELLFELARRVEDQLPATLERAHAWDQVDALRFVDATFDREQKALQRAARRMQTEESAELRALGLEAQLTLDAALGLVSLIERRLATLVRLRLRAENDTETNPLLPEGRPFVDLGAALFETARRWA